MSRAPVKQTLTIPGPAGGLEALVEAPAGAGSERMAILCHPHPQFQGTMHNKVVHTLARAMNDLGIAAMRFNFRGVGASQGSYGEGHGEVEDIYAVADYVRQHWPGASIWLAGFSFGAVVSARAAQQVAPLQLISVAPAVNVLGRELQEIPAMPWLIVQGDADEVVPEAEVTAWVNGLEPQPDYIVMPGVGHFFHGHLVDLRTLLINHLQSTDE